MLLCVFHLFLETDLSEGEARDTRWIPSRQQQKHNRNSLLDATWARIEILPCLWCVGPLALQKQNKTKRCVYHNLGNASEDYTRKRLGGDTHLPCSSMGG